MVPPSEAAYWMAILSGSGEQRNLAKQLLYAWCVAGHRSAAELWTVDATEIAEQCGFSTQQLDELRPLRDAVGAKESLLAGLMEMGVGMVTRADVAYPEEWAGRLPEKGLPYTLSYKGDLAILTEPGVAIIGTGQPDPEAERMAQAQARLLVAQGRHLVGGYERGVDRLALDLACELGGQTTIVLPLGIRQSRALLADDKRVYSDKKRLALSPYEPDAPLREIQARARWALVIALCDTLLVIAPEQGPGSWPQVAEVLTKGVQAFIWEAKESDAGRAWAALGATPIADPKEVWHSGGRPLSAAMAAEEDDMEKALDDVGAPVTFGSAEEAIDILGRTGRVPEKLAGRLRQSSAFPRATPSDRGGPPQA